MSIIIIGVGQAEFDGESPPTPMLCSWRLQALGVALLQSERSLLASVISWVSWQAQVFVCPGAYVSERVPHTHTPRLWRGGLMTPPSSHPESLGAGSWART